LVQTTSENATVLIPATTPIPADVISSSTAWLVSASIASHATSSAMINAVPATTRCLALRARCRIAGAVVFPMMVPIEKTGKSRPAAHPKPR
jgi:hypothetical protein